jgi:hypothetical protein
MLAAAAVVCRQHQAERLARSQAIKDALTGLANYRHLMDTLQGEIRRAQRCLPSCPRSAGSDPSPTGSSRGVVPTVQSLRSEAGGALLGAAWVTG